MERLIELLKTILYNSSYEEKRETIKKIRKVIDEEEENLNERVWNN